MEEALRLPPYTKSPIYHIGRQYAICGSVDLLSILYAVVIISGHGNRSSFLDGVEQLSNK